MAGLDFEAGMPGGLTAAGELKVSTAHEDLQLIMRTARAHPACPEDFDVSWGHRNARQQQYMVDNGWSSLKFPKSLHNKIPSLAVDVVIRHNGEVTWEWERYERLSAHILRVFFTLKLTGKVAAKRLVWGGKWRSRDGTHYELRF